MLENLDDIINTLLSESYHQFVFGQSSTLEEIEIYLGLRCEVCHQIYPNIMSLILPPHGIEFARLLEERSMYNPCACPF